MPSARLREPIPGALSRFRKSIQCGALEFTLKLDSFVLYLKVDVSFSKVFPSSRRFRFRWSPAPCFDAVSTLDVAELGLCDR